MPRIVKFWVGDHPDQAIPPRVKIRLFEQANGHCQKCTRKIWPGDVWQADHVVALINGGPHSEDNLQVLCDWCHKEKTKADVKEKSIAYRKRKKNLLRKKRSIRRWRKFDGTVVVAPKER